MSLLGATPSSGVSIILGALSIAFLYFAVRDVRARIKEARKRQDAWARQIREDVRDEFKVAAETQLALTHDEKTRFRELQMKHQEAVDSDRKWSAAPFTFIAVRPRDCSISLKVRQGTTSVFIRNRFDSQRVIFVSGNLALYRDGVELPICTVAVPSFSVEVKGNEEVQACSPWSIVFSGDQIQALAAVYRLDQRLNARFVDLKVTTVVDLTTNPHTVSDSAGMLVSEIFEANVVSD